MKTLLETTEKYLDLISHPKESNHLERLFLWLYDKVPQTLNINGDNGIRIWTRHLQESKRNIFLTKEGSYLYSSKDYHNTLCKNQDYVYTLQTMYHDGSTVIVMKDALILLPNYEEEDFYLFNIIAENIDVAKKYAELVNWKKNNAAEQIRFGYLLLTSSGRINERHLKSPKPVVDLSRNYNSDLPITGIEKFITSSKPGLMIFNGEPGTGKSTFIKYLISEHQDITWIIVPSRIMETMNGVDEIFGYFLGEVGSPDRIYILEDCEKLLLRRERGSSLETLLNMTDGLLGDSVGTKFICTFNTPLTNIDPAILRKGRLKLKYEFGPLSLEKTRLHLPEATSPMTLADIYNQEENGGDTKRKKIGY